MAGWEVYDPGWLVEAARQHEPGELKLHEALAKCILAQTESEAYVRFADPANPNQPGSEWQFETNVILENTKNGTVVLDVLKDGRIGGVEFLDRIPLG